MPIRSGIDTALDRILRRQTEGGGKPETELLNPPPVQPEAPPTKPPAKGLTSKLPILSLFGVGAKGKQLQETLRQKLKASEPELLRKLGAGLGKVVLLPGSELVGMPSFKFGKPVSELIKQAEKIAAKQAAGKAITASEKKILETVAQREALAEAKGVIPKAAPEVIPAREITKEPWQMTWEEIKAIRKQELASAPQQVATAEQEFAKVRSAFDATRVKETKRIKAINTRISRLNPTGEIGQVDSASQKIIADLESERGLLVSKHRSEVIPNRGEFVNKAIPESTIPPSQKIHLESIQQALSEGKPVPAEVLKDYPDLAAKAAPVTPEVTTISKVSAIHVTSNPQPVIDALRAGKNLGETRAEGLVGDLGVSGLYVSQNPQMWLGRATAKWSFLEGLTPEQKTKLIDKVVKSVDEQMKYGGIADFEYQNLMRDINYVKQGELDVNVLVSAANQPFNIPFWQPEYLADIGIKQIKMPIEVAVKAKGKFADVTKAKITDELIRNLKEQGYDGMVHRGTWGLSEQTVIWNPKTIEQFGKYTQPVTPTVPAVPQAVKPIAEGITKPVKGVMPQPAKAPPIKPPEVPPSAISPELPPEVPPLSTTLQRVNQAFTPPRVTQPLKEKVGEVMASLEENISDKFARINKLTARVQSQLGTKLSPELNAELQVANLAGAGDAGLQKAKDIFRLTTDALGKDVGSNYLDGYLHLRHMIDIEAFKGQRLIAGGIKGAIEAKKLLSDMATELGTQKFAKLEQGAAIIKDYYRDILQRKVESGLVSKDVADMLNKIYPWYNPIKLIDYIGKFSETGGKKLSVTSSGLRRLSELGSEAARERPLNTLASASIRAEVLIRRNDATRAVIRLAELDKQLAGKIVRTKAPSFGKEKAGTLSYMDGGHRITYKVPTWLEREAKYFTNIPVNQIEKISNAINAVSRAGFTGVNLAFFIPNLAVDTLTAMITQRVTPMAVLKRLALNLKDIVSEDALIAQLRRSGGGQSGLWGKNLDEIAKQAAKQGQLVLKNQWDWKRIMGLPLETISKIGHAVEMAPRTAVFEKALKAGKPLEEATLAARRATIDFSRSGAAIRQANNLYLYLNAGVQGSLLPFRALRDSAMARWALGGFMGTVMASYAWNRQFPEYDDVPDYIKYGAFVVMLPSEEYDKYGQKVPHYITVIPNLREWAFFSGPLLYGLRKVDERNPEDMSMFLKDLMPIINPLSQFVGEGSLPVPTQLGSTIVEMQLNRDTFRNRPIISDDLINLPPEKQYNEYTSETAIRVGQLLRYSPLKLDFFVKSVFGGLGQQVLSAIDATLLSKMPREIEPHIKELFTQLKDITPPFIAPEDVSRERKKFLATLSVTDREALLEYERKPEKPIPIITPIARRFYKEYGGQLYRTGQALAEKETGISSEQTAQASKLLSKVSMELTAGQEQIDKSLQEGKITLRQWVDNKNEASILYQGALLGAGLLYPASVQAQKDTDAWDNYLKQLHTLALSMPDRRTRGELLVSAWRAIKPIEIIPGRLDFDTFFKRRDAFMSSLIPEDKALLQDELTAGMSLLTKTYQAASTDKSLTPYFELLDDEREAYRINNPTIDVNLNLLGIVSTVKTPTAMKMLQAKLDELKVPYSASDAFGENVEGADGKPLLSAEGIILRKAKIINDKDIWDDSLSYFPKYLRDYLWTQKKGWDNPDIGTMAVKIAIKKREDKFTINQYNLHVLDLSNEERQLRRIKEPETDAALNLWGYIENISTPKALEILKAKASELGIDFKELPGIKGKDVSETAIWDRSLSFVPDYMRTYLLRSGDLTTLASKAETILKARQKDKFIIDSYDIANETNRAKMRISNPELDAILNLWGRLSTVKSERAWEILKDKAAKFGIPADSLPASPVKKMQTTREDVIFQEKPKETVEQVLARRTKEFSFR